MGKHRSVAVWLALLFGVVVSSNGDSNESVSQAVAVDCKITRTGASHCQFLVVNLFAFLGGDTVQLTVTQSGRVITCRRRGDAAGEENTWYGTFCILDYGSWSLGWTLLIHVCIH
jgi:hypothetical protein